jgi:hypothetical protein
MSWDDRELVLVKGREMPLQQWVVARCQDFLPATRHPQPMEGSLSLLVGLMFAASEVAGSARTLDVSHSVHVTSLN